MLLRLLFFFIVKSFVPPFGILTFNSILCSESADALEAVPDAVA